MKDKLEIQGIKNLHMNMKKNLMNRVVKKFLISGWLLLIVLNGGGQALSDSGAYYKGLIMIDSANTAEEYMDAGNYFDALSAGRHNDWLAPLYASLSYILASRAEPDSRSKDELCDKAQVFIDSANTRHADIAESSSLQAFLYQTRIEVSPMERGLEYSMKADTEIKRAETVNPDDPRPYFLYAMNVYYTPAIFGGGASKALPLFEKAAEKFDAFVPEMPFMPHWGKQQNLEMIQKCKDSAERK